MFQYGETKTLISRNVGALFFINTIENANLCCPGRSSQAPVLAALLGLPRVESLCGLPVNQRS